MPGFGRRKTQRYIAVRRATKEIPWFVRLENQAEAKHPMKSRIGGRWAEPVGDLIGLHRTKALIPQNIGQPLWLERKHRVQRRAGWMKTVWDSRHKFVRRVPRLP